MDRFKKLRSGEINWSTSIREYVKEREEPKKCIYCGAEEKLTLEHILPSLEEDRTNRATQFWSAGDATPAKGVNGPTSGSGSKRKITYRELLKEST